MTAVIICLGRPFSRQIPDVLKLLNVLLAENIPPEEKYHILSSEFSIEITSQLKKEVSLMCNLSEGIERKGIRKGMKRGMRRGRRLGKIQGAISVYHDFHLPEQKILQNLEEKFHLTPEEEMCIRDSLYTVRFSYVSGVISVLHGYGFQSSGVPERDFLKSVFGTAS